MFYNSILCFFLVSNFPILPFISLFPKTHLKRLILGEGTMYIPKQWNFPVTLPSSIHPVKKNPQTTKQQAQTNNPILPKPIPPQAPWIRTRLKPRIDFLITKVFLSKVILWCFGKRSYHKSTEIYIVSCL